MSDSKTDPGSDSGRGSGGRRAKPDILQGTLDLLILRALHNGAMHGWAISQRIQQVSDDVLLIQQGSLYPSLHRLERRGWIAAEWGLSENNRRAKFYRLTEAGERRLTVETERWETFSAAIHRVLQHA
ncbi:MAG: PadR family transcriptional regulator [Acidobacteriota bacterium]